MKTKKNKYSNRLLVEGHWQEFLPYKSKRTAKGGYYQGQHSAEYWKQRNRESLAETFENADALKTYEMKIYERELRQVVKEYKELIEPYVENGEFVRTNFDDTFLYKQQRLLEEIDTFTQLVAEEQPQRLAELLEDVYVANGKRLLAQMGVANDNIYLFDEPAVRNTVRRAWTADGREFSDRIWQNTEALNRGLRNTLTNSIARGEAPNRTIREFKRLFGNTTYNTGRIILTETSAIYNQSAIDTYKQAGINELEVIGSSTDGECSPFISKKIQTAEAQVGVNTPPFHPFCKCSVIPVVEW